MWYEPGFEVTKDRVSRGAALLDKHDPDWHSKVADVSLQLMNPVNCVLYHVFGGYHVGLGRLGLRWDEAVDHGFCGLSPYLVPCWTAEIMKRMTKKEAVTV